MKNDTDKLETQAKAGAATMLAGGTSINDVVKKLIRDYGLTESVALGLTLRAEYEVKGGIWAEPDASPASLRASYEAQSGLRPESPDLSWLDRIPGGFGSLLVALILVGFVGYNNVVAFNAGRDGCRLGQATETQCGLQTFGTPRGKIFGIVTSGPGFLLGRAFASDDDKAN